MSELLSEPTTFSGLRFISPPDNLHASGPMLGAMATGDLPGPENFGMYEDPGHGETLFFSSGDLSEMHYLYACRPALTAYYVIPKTRIVPEAGSGGLLRYLDMEALEGGLPYQVILCNTHATPRDVRTLESQRKERQATAELARRVASLLPTFSEADLGRLVGVSRIAWRAWTSAETAARRGKRQRLLRLERILSLRTHVDPDTPLSHWLDTPIGMGVETTPAQLLADGRDQLVAILAARISAPAMDERQRLSLPPRLRELVDRLPIDEHFAERRAVYAQDDEDEAR